MVAPRFVVVVEDDDGVCCEAVGGIAITGAEFVFGTVGTFVGYVYDKPFVDVICLLFGFIFDTILRLSLCGGKFIEGLPFNNGFFIPLT